MASSLLLSGYRSGFALRDGRPRYPNLWHGLVGAWGSGLGPTGVTFDDQSRFGNNGTLTAMNLATDWVVSEGRYALDLDGSDDFIEIGSIPNFSITANWTIMGWVAPSKVAATFSHFFGFYHISI